MDDVGTACLRMQVISSDDPNPPRSIMFDETRHLSVTGTGGSVTTKLLGLDGLGLSLGRVQSSGHEIELKESRNFTVLLPSAGLLDVRIADADYRVHPGRPIIFRPTERRTRASALVGAGFRATTLQISVDRIRRLANVSDLPPERIFARDASDLSGPAGRYLARQLPQLADDLFSRPDLMPPPKVLAVLATLIDEQICTMLGVTAESLASRSLLPAFHRVRQAEDLMHARSDEPLSMLEIAETLGVSLRSLQLAFNEVYDLGPRDILNRIRLNKARLRLLTASRDTQVTTVALDCGFFHLSRFAQAYARHYGERPSETLARRRA